MRFPAGSRCSDRFEDQFQHLADRAQARPDRCTCRFHFAFCRCRSPCSRSAQRPPCMGYLQIPIRPALHELGPAPRSDGPLQRGYTANARPNPTVILLQCQRRDSNPDTVRYQILSLACLPIPPRRSTAWKLQCRGSHADFENGATRFAGGAVMTTDVNCAGGYLLPTRTVSMRLVCDCTL